MFCNNCGHQIGDGEQFCVKCGKQLAKKEEALCCEACGKPIEPDAKFCNACGKPLTKEAKLFCKHCGQQFEEGEQFCKKCGSPAEEKAPLLGRFGDTLSGLTGKLTGNRKLGVSAGGALVDKEASLSMKHMIMAGLFALVLLFWFIPSISLELDAYFISDEYSISMGAPYADDDIETLMSLSVDDFDALKAATTVMVILLDVTPIVLAIVFTLLPIFKKTLIKRRRYILQKIIAIRAFIGSFLNLMTFKIICEDASGGFGEAGAHLTFGGWLLMLLLIGLIVFTFVISAENKRNTPPRKKEPQIWRTGF